VTVDSPGQGTWTLQVRGSGEYSVAAVKEHLAGAGVRVRR